MSEQSWEQRPLPDTTGRAEAVWEWQISRPAELTAARGHLRDDLAGEALPEGADSDDVDRLLLTFEEIASNGLRHGGPPVTVTVTTSGSALSAGEPANLLSGTLFATGFSAASARSRPNRSSSRSK